MARNHAFVVILGYDHDGSVVKGVFDTQGDAEQFAATVEGGDWVAIEEWSGTTKVRERDVRPILTAQWGPNNEWSKP